MENFEFDSVVRELLKELCSEHRLPPTSSLLSSWKKGLYGISPDTIKKASVILFQQERKFLPSSGDFRKICVQYDADKIIQSRRKEAEIIEPLDKPEAKKAYQEITTKLKHRETNNNERPSLLLYDFLNREGRLYKAICKNHVDLSLFNSECDKVFRSEPRKSFHGFRVFKIVHPPSDAQRGARSFSTYVDCDLHQKGAEKITIGIY